MRVLRRILDIGLPLAGVVTILSAVLFLQEIRGQIAVVMIGIILIEAGVWKLAHQLLPNDRQFHHLRSEIDTFIQLCRKLNDTALKVKSTYSEENQKKFDDVRDELQQSLDRITEVAGKTKEDISETPEHMQVS